MAALAPLLLPCAPGRAEVPALSSPPARVQVPSLPPFPPLPSLTVPHNPFMAPNGESEIHDDGWRTDAYAWGGALGRSP